MYQYMSIIDIIDDVVGTENIIQSKQKSESVCTLQFKNVILVVNNGVENKNDYFLCLLFSKNRSILLLFKSL